jgi:hypothetical protein
MDKELSEHSFKANDQQAVEGLKELFEFTTPSDLRKSLQITFFSYLKEQADKGQDKDQKQVIVDFELLFDFLMVLDS